MKKSKLIKTHSVVRPTYTVFRNRCPICMRLHGKSKLFTTLYHLQNHLCTHSTEDESTTGILIKNIKNIILQIAQALEWGMLLN